MSEGLKVIGLKVDGLRKLTAVQMEFSDKGLIQIRGKNLQGKTSILDSFEILLKGAKYIEEDMITHGKDRCEIIGYIDEYEVKRVITAKTNRIEIKDKNGRSLPKPQAFLDTLINQLTFDPRPFLRKTAGQKLQFMMELLKINFDDINKEIDEHETERLLLGREIKNYGEFKLVEKAERVNVSDLISERDKIVKINTKAREEYQSQREQAIQEVYRFNDLQKNRKIDIEDIQSSLNNLKDKREEMMRSLELIDKKIASKKKEVENLPQPEPYKNVDDINIPMRDIQTAEIAVIDEEISKVNEINLKAQIYEQYLEKKKEKELKEHKYKQLDGQIRILRAKKQKVLKETKMPIDGLEIREESLYHREGLYHNGIFSENWGESEGLSISSALCVAMKPELRAIFIDDGESYDTNNLKELEKWAVEHNIQCFLTRVDSEEGTSHGDIFYIVDGSVV